jgi:diacylglycerol kinase (ATP)
MITDQSIQTITCIINGIRPISAEFRMFIETLKAIYGNNITVFYTEYKGHAIEIASKYSFAGHLIMAIGGDGTFNEVVNGIMSSKNGQAALCLIPNGTGNDFCRSQAIRFDTQNILFAIKNPEFKNYDLGQVSSVGHVRYFLNVMDAGFGGHATMLLDRQRKLGLRGGLSYSIAILRTFFKFKKPEVEIFVDNKLHYSGKMMMLAVSNSNSFGNGLIIYPDSRPDDGLLGVTTLGNVTILDYILNLSNLRKGNYIKHYDIKYTVCSKLSLNILSGTAPVETDGEVFGAGNFDVSVIPSILRVLKY